MTSRLPLFLDCDTGIDDAIALAYLLGTPAAQLVGIGTVSGNTTAEQAGENTLRLLDLAGAADVPVAVGAHDHVSGPYAGGSPDVHGRNGIGDVALAESAAAPVTESAPAMLVRLARELPGQLRVAAIGPLTNIALALDLEPRLPELVAELVVMGGAVWEPGNITPLAEANIFHDPDAADRVLAADGPWEVTLVPLDLTRQHRFTDEHAAVLAAEGGALGGALSTMLSTYLGFYEGVDGVRAAPLHDPLAVAVAAGRLPGPVARRTGLRVDVTDGPGRGRTVPDPDRPAVAVLTSLADDAAPAVLAGVLAATTVPELAR